MALVVCMYDYVVRVGQRAKEEGERLFAVLLVRLYPFAQPISVQVLTLIRDGFCVTQEALTAETIRAIPETLRSLCLFGPGLEAVKASGAIQLLVHVFASADERHLALLDFNNIGYLTGALEEMFRHFRELLNPGLQALIAVLSKLYDTQVCLRLPLPLVASLLC